MTLPPEKLGDRNQRYEVQTLDWPKEDGTWQAVGWSTTSEGAVQMIEATLLHPSVEDARYRDRWA